MHIQPNTCIFTLKEQALSTAMATEVEYIEGCLPRHMAWLHATVPPIIHGDIKMLVSKVYYSRHTTGQMYYLTIT